MNDTDQCPQCVALRTSLTAQSAECARLREQYEGLDAVFERLCPNHASNADLAPHIRLGEDMPSALRRIVAERAAITARLAESVGVKEVESLVKWLLGEEGEFPSPPEHVPGKPRKTFYWRSELRRRWIALSRRDGGA